MTGRAIVDGTLRAAFAPYLAEANCCACPVCLAVGEQLLDIGGELIKRDPVAYWAAVSEQLRVLAAGGHRRIEWRDHVVELDGLSCGPATPAPGFNVGRDGGLVGIGLGIGSGLHDRNRGRSGGAR